MNMDGVDGDDDDEDEDGGGTSWTRPWCGSALLRLVFVGAAVQAAYLYVRLRQDGQDGDGGPPGGRGQDEGERRLEATCAAFAALGALLVLAMQSGLRTQGRGTRWRWRGRGGAGEGATPAPCDNASHRLHPGDVFESWMYECVAAASAEVLPQSEARAPPGAGMRPASTQPPAVPPAVPAQSGGGVVPVFVRLQGRVLSVWGPAAAAGPASRLVGLVPRVALWSEQEASLAKARASLTRRRRFLLHGGAVTLLPEGVSKARRWSRKHPICITASQKLDDEEVVEDEPVTTALDPSLTTLPTTASVADVSATRVVLVTSDSSQELDMAPTSATPSSATAGQPPPQLQTDDPFLAEAAASATTVSGVGVSARRPASLTLSDSASSRSSASDSRVSSDLPNDVLASSATPDGSVGSPNHSVAADPDPVGYPEPQADSETSDASGSGDLEDVADVEDVEDVQERLLQKIVSELVTEELVGLVDDDEALDSEGPSVGAQTPCSLLLLARTARQKEEWFWRLRRACGEPHPLDDAVVLEDYAAALQTLDGGEGLDAGLDGLNALAGRLLFDACHSERWAALVRADVQRRVAALAVPDMVERPVVTAFHCRATGVRLHRVGPPVLDAHGLWVDLDVSYRGLVRLVLTTRLNLAQPPQQPHAKAPGAVGEEAEECLKNDGCELGGGRGPEDPAGAPPPTPPPPRQHERGTWRLLKRLAESRFFQAALAALASTDIVLAVELRALDGVLCVHVPPPPSDRVWLGFRGVPRLRLVTVPRVGGRNLRHAVLCRLIERKLREQLERTLVLPNMTSVLVPFPFPPTTSAAGSGRQPV